MKYCLLLLLAFSSCSPKITTSRVSTTNGKLMGVLPLDQEGQVYYSFNIPAKNATADQVFRRARRWFVQNYHSAKDILQVTDPVSGELIGKGSFVAVAVKTTKETDVTYSQADYNTSKFYTLGETISVTAKEGGCVLEISGLLLESDPLERASIIGSKTELLNLCRNIDDHANALPARIEKAINTPEPTFR